MCFKNSTKRCTIYFKENFELFLQIKCKDKIKDLNLEDTAHLKNLFHLISKNNWDSVSDYQK